MLTCFSSYIESVVAVGICSFICEWICMCGKSSENIKKTVSLIASLCVFITVIVPFSSGIRDLLSNFSLSHTSVETEKENFDNDFYSLVAEESEKMIEEKIFEKFGIIPDGVNIDLCEQENELKLYSITVTVSEEDQKLYSLIETYLKELGFQNVILKNGDAKDEST